MLESRDNLHDLGKAMCQIGSFPGFEDGDFESAKLVCPASSFYHAAEDCLYIADSEVCIDEYLLILI